jgi:hypothetical protein
VELDAGVCGAPPPVCPAQPPDDGAPCCFNAPLENPCFYPCSFGDGGIYATSSAKCDGTRWHVARSACSPPPRDAAPDLTFGPDE